jgi:hypothetical protein
MPKPRAIEDDFRFVLAKTGKPKEPGLGSSRRRGTDAGGMRNRIIDATRRKPNVMVKITGFSKSTGPGLALHLDYISRNSQNEVFDSTGRSFDEIGPALGLSTRDALQEYGQALAESMQEPGKRGRPRERTAMHLMLSMPPGTDKPGFEIAVRDFLRESFSNHDHLFTFHDDTAHYHAHIVVGLQGHDGKWLNPRKDDLADWRHDFAAALERAGIAAQATPAYSRGAAPRNRPARIEQMARRDQRDGTRSRRRPDVSPTYDAEVEAGAIARRADAWERIARHYEQRGDSDAAGAVREHLAERFRRHQPRPAERDADHER